MIPEYNTILFTDLFPNPEDFVTLIKESGLNVLTDDSLQVLYRLLFAKYGNNPLANYDINQSVMKVASVIYQYGPAWEKRLDIQKKLRELNEEEITTGITTIQNQASNPEHDPGTDGTEVLPYIDHQNSNKIRKSKLEGYAILTNLIETDVTKEFLDKFSVCFKRYVRPDHPTIYVSDSDEEEY